MIKIIKDFYVNGNVNEVFLKLQLFLPKYLNQHPEDEYKVVEEKMDGHQFYRKSTLRKQSFIKELPQMIRKSLPKDFLQSVGDLIEETVFDGKDKKIQFSITSKNIYHLTGTSRFISLNKEKCKVSTILYFNLLEAEKYFPNKTISAMMLPILKTKVPEMFIMNQNMYYNDISRNYKLKP